MDVITGWLADEEPGALVLPTILPGFTDSRTFRAAFPDCVAYGFFPQRHQTLYDTAPLIHSADERIDVRDLAYTTTFVTGLHRTLLGRRPCLSARRGLFRLPLHARSPTATTPTSYSN
jgi:acetylornithine deacetylase/succinyl-diaminopimelate desuccinylase-like protein